MIASGRQLHRWVRAGAAGAAGAAAVALAAAGVSPLAAQRPGLREVRDVGRAGLNLAVAVPVGPFGEHVDVAGGLNLFGAVNLGRGGALGLRLDGSYLIYGSDHSVVAQSTHSIVTFGAGPQLTLGRGPVRLYGFGTAGVSYIWTHTSFSPDGCGCDIIASQTDFDDWTGALQAGGGLLVTLRARRTPIALDLGARYLSHGDAWYVAPGDVVPRSDGVLLVYPSHSRLDLVVLHLGVSVGLR